MDTKGSEGNGLRVVSIRVSWAVKKNRSKTEHEYEYEYDGRTKAIM
jgi:hypothetical protein